jgi:hypothetical protein
VRTYTGSSPALEIFLFVFLFLYAFLILPVAVSSQMTPPALGRLHITSRPTGADITIDNALRPEKTNVTLVVSPRTYVVLVSGGSEHLNCSATVTVSAGQTVEVTCPTK